MAIQFGGFRPDKTAGYASALAALLGEQTRRRAVESDIASKDKGPDLWKQSFMEKDLAQQKEIAEMQEAGRGSRFTSPQAKPLSVQDRALQALAGGSVLPGLDTLGTRKLAKTLPDIFQLMVPQMEEQMKRRAGEGGRVESGDQNRALMKQLYDLIVGGAPIGKIPSRYERVAD